jgi:hypothetical protein
MEKGEARYILKTNKEDIYRITAIFKVETDIITIISASPIGRGGMFVTMSVSTFKTSVTLYILETNTTIWHEMPCA